MCCFHFCFFYLVDAVGVVAIGVLSPEKNPQEYAIHKSTKDPMTAIANVVLETSIGNNGMLLFLICNMYVLLLIHLLTNQIGKSIN